MMASQKKVAIITGGASGMGFAVSKVLASREDWEVHIFDIDAKGGNETARKLGAVFHEVDVTKYSSLANAFSAVFKSSGRLDFVHANAGIVDRDNFYAVHDTGVDPPPEPNTLVIDIDLTSVIHTSFLAQHYFRQTPKLLEGPRSLIVTASCVGFYACPVTPMYGAAKAGAVEWTRSIAERMWREDGVRVNAICPGVVRTNLMPEEGWQMFPKDSFTPIEKILEVILMLLDEEQNEKHGKKFVGQTVEICGTSHYFTVQQEFCDPKMEAVMSGAKV